MSSQISGVALNPQNVAPTDFNISSTVYSIFPPYQNTGSGSYLTYINGNSDIYLQTRYGGSITASNFSYSTIPLALVGNTTGSQPLYQNMGDFSNFPLTSRIWPHSFFTVAVAWNGSVWIAVGSGGNVVSRSTDGITWAPTGGTLFGQGGFAVVWNPTNSVWLVGGSNSFAFTPTIGISRDNGITWTPITNFIMTGSNIPGRPFWANTLNFFGIGNSNLNTIIRSSNGITWPFVTNLGSIFIQHAVWNGNVFIAASANTFILRSLDGISWATTSITNFTTRAVAYSPTLGMWQVVGTSGTINTPLIYYSFFNSYNSATWLPANGVTQSIGGGTQIGFFDIIWANNQFVAVGSSNQNYGCFTSSDGINYTRQASTIISVSGSEAYGIAYSPSLNLYVAVGSDPNSLGRTLATSSNLTSWSLNSNVFGGFGNAVTWSSEQELFVAAGGSATATLSNCLASSSNGIDWFTFRSNSNDNFARGFGVTYAPELRIWVATGFTNNSILTSSNGYNWNVVPTTIGPYGCVRGLAWSPEQNQYVAVGRSSNFVISTSPDGITWRGRASLNIFEITYGGNAIIWVSELSLWIALGRGNSRIVTSPDGITWTTVSSSPFSTSGNAIAWNGSLLVALGSGGNTIATSSNGRNWTGRGTTIFSTEGRGVNWIPTLRIWVASGVGTNTLATSSDGITWVGQGLTYLTSTGVSGNCIGFSRELNQIIAVGQDVTSGIHAIYSSNGTTWQPYIHLNTYMNTVYGVAWNGVIWVAVGTGSNTVMSSPDGMNWTGRGTPINTVILPGGVAWNGSLWVVCGGGATNRVATSPDGITWTPRGLVGHTSNHQVIWYPHRSIWMMTGTSSNAIFVSTDGITWTSRATQTMGSNRGIAYDTNGLLVLVGTSQTNFSNILQTSPDGVTWTTRINTLTNTVNNFNNVAYSPTLNLWVAAAQAGANSLMTSSNGITWIPRGNRPFAGLVSWVTWNNNYFIAVGGNCNAVATSADGINWRSLATRPNENSNMTYVGIRPPIMVAGGEGTYSICTTSDYGASWQPRFSTNTVINTVSWNGNIWVSGARDGSILTSPNGVTWTTRTSPFTSSINASIWAERLKLWVLCGDYPWSFATSTDGVNWTGRVSTTLVFEKAMAIEWNGTYFISLGRGSNSIARSTDGSNWLGLGVQYGNPNRFASISWNGNIFAGTLDITTTVFISSNNGCNWTNGANFSTSAVGRSIKWNGSLFAAFGSCNTYLLSSNGINWSNGPAFLPVSTVTCANWDTINRQWYISSEDPSINRNYLITSPDLSNFSPRITFPDMCNVTNFTFASTINLWVGTGSSNANIVTSPDGFTWTQRLANSFGTAFGVAWNGTQFVAVGGSTSQFFTSSNGITWVNRTNGGIAVLSVVNGITWATSLSLWVATGQNSGATQGIIATSTDGINWTSRNTDIFTTRATHVAWNGSLFVAVGEGTNVFATSSDGITWTGRGADGITTAGRGIVWATSPGQTSLWVAVGSGTNSIATSPDGTTWTGRTTTSIFSVQGNEVVNNGSVTVAVGEGTNTYAWSYDNGVNWTAGGTSAFTTAGTALGWSPITGQWVGGSSNIPYFLSSPDGITWTGRTNFTSSIQVIAMQTRERNFTINNSNWTGRTSQQNFRIIS